MLNALIIYDNPARGILGDLYKVDLVLIAYRAEDTVQSSRNILYV